MKVSGLILIVATLAFSTVFSSCQPLSATNRKNDVVVVDGSMAPTLIGAPVGLIVAYAWLNGAWKQIPTQVDERVLKNIGPLAHRPCGVAESVATGGTPTRMGYSCTPQVAQGDQMVPLEIPGSDLLVFVDEDPGMRAGADNNPLFDSDDEVAFRAMDSSPSRASVSSPPVVPLGVDPATRVDVRVLDPLNQNVGYVTLFRWVGPAGPPVLEPPNGAKPAYSYGPLPEPIEPWSTNLIRDPEDSTVETPYYQLHYSGRQMLDQLRLRAPGRAEVDIIDRQPIRQVNSTDGCYGTEETFSANKSAWVTQKDGPIRSIRAGFLTFSAHFNYFETVFTVDRLITHQVTQAHPFTGYLGSGFDFDPMGVGSGWLVKTSLDPSWATVDGIEDAPWPEFVWGTRSDPLRWIAVDGGTQGGILAVLDSNQDSRLQIGRYFSDNDSAGQGLNPCGTSWPPPQTGFTGDGKDYGFVALAARGSPAGTDIELTYPWTSLCDTAGGWWWCGNPGSPIVMDMTTYFSTSAMPQSSVDELLQRHDTPLAVQVVPS